jgi:hypothetical protein
MCDVRVTQWDVPAGSSEERARACDHWPEARWDWSGRRRAGMGWVCRLVLQGYSTSAYGGTRGCGSCWGPVM